jgi:hypothetical protein
MNTNEAQPTPRSAAVPSRSNIAKPNAFTACGVILKHSNLLRLGQPRSVRKNPRASVSIRG